MAGIPLWAVAAALQAGSVIAADRYNKAIGDEQSRLRAAEIEREGLRQKERDVYLETLLGEFGREDVESRTDEATAQRESRMDRVSAMAPANVEDYVGSGSAPTTVSNDIGTAIANYVRFGKENTKRRARLGAFGDVNLDDSIKIMRTGDELGMLDDFTRGGQRVLGTELDQVPRYAGRGWKTLSDTAGAAGSAVSWYDIFNNAANLASPTTAGAKRNIPVNKSVVSQWGR